MFSFRRETDYAIQFLKQLAYSKNEISLKEVSESIGVSFLFLQKIARKLRLAKIVESEQGASGGYKLAVLPNHLSLYQIIAITEGQCALLPCLGKNNFSCTKQKTCHLKSKVVKLNKELIKMLTKLKLSDL